MKNGSTCPTWPAYRRLSAAVLKRAALDARKGSAEACNWLLSGGALLYLDVLDLSARLVDEFIGEMQRGGLVAK